MAGYEAGKNSLEPVYKELYTNPRNLGIINKQESSPSQPHPPKKGGKKREKKGNGKDLKQVFVMFTCFIDLRKSFLTTNERCDLAGGSARGFLNGSKRELLLEFANVRGSAEL